MICRHGGLTSVRHNEIRDLTADWLDKVCHDVAIEPPFQRLTGETIVPTTANWQDEANADIHAWGRRQGAFFDFRVFHQMHLVIEIQLFQLSIGIMSRRRRGHMVIVYKRLKRPLLPLYFLRPLGVWVRRQLFSTVDLLICCPTRTIFCIVQLWPG